eukprot:7236497-Pyramimonas_sp.AAC.1
MWWPKRRSSISSRPSPSFSIYLLLIIQEGAGSAAAPSVSLARSTWRQLAYPSWSFSCLPVGPPRSSC